MKVKDVPLRLLILSLGVIDVLETDRDAKYHVTLKLLCVFAVQEIAGLAELQTSLVFVNRSRGKKSVSLERYQHHSSPYPKLLQTQNTYAESQVLNKLLLQLRTFVSDVIDCPAVDILDLGSLLHRFENLALDIQKKGVVLLLSLVGVNQEGTSNVGAIRLVTDTEGANNGTGVQIPVVRNS